HTCRGAVPHTAGPSLEWPARRVPAEGEGAASGRLHPAGAGSAAERSRQGLVSCPREAEPGLRPLHPGPHRPGTADQGGPLEGDGEVEGRLATGNGTDGTDASGAWLEPPTRSRRAMSPSAPRVRA